MRISKLVIGLAVAILVVPQLLEAQVITGVIVDAASGQRLADASITLLDKKGKLVAGRLSEPDGSYSIPAPGPGKYTLRSGGYGYMPWDSPEIELAEGETIEFPVQLMKEGTGAGLEAFERRRLAGVGLFLLDEDLRGKGELFTDLLRNVEGVQIVDILVETRETRAGERERSGSDVGHHTVRLVAGQQNFNAGARQGLERDDDCPPLIYINGAWAGIIDRLSTTGPDKDIIADEVIAIEIFQRNEIPPEFDLGRQSKCGVISVWKENAR
jgi:Carboxypeptidase regulatory-like domain